VLGTMPDNSGEVRVITTKRSKYLKFKEIK
jgi:hypothetical protein